MKTFATLENKKQHQIAFRIDRDNELNAWILFKKRFDHSAFPKEYAMHWSPEEPCYIAPDSSYGDEDYGSFEVCLGYMHDQIEKLLKKGFIELEEEA